MHVDSEFRRSLSRGIGVVGAIAGTTAVVAATSPGTVAAAQPGHDGAPSSGATTGATPAAVPGTYESCTAVFGLTQKNSASWVQFDVVANGPITPPVTIGGDLQAIVTVHGTSGAADVECAADVPTWSTEAEWLEFVRVQRGVGSLDTITGRYPYPGGPGYAIPGVGTTYVVGSSNLLTEAITVSGASVRFVESSPGFSVVSGSPQDLQNLAWSAGSDESLQRVLAIDPDFTDTLTRCRATPVTASPDAIAAAVAALGSVWGIDVDAVFPPTSPSIADRCSALDQAQSYYFATAVRSLTVGSTATVTVEPPPPPSTSTTATTSTTPSAAVAAGAEIMPTFTG
jgi:hypothetical protein